MKSLIVYIAFLLLIPFTGCYTVLLTTENTYEEELIRLESGDEAEEMSYEDGWIYAPRVEEQATWFDYYNLPWWYVNPMVSKDINPNRIDGGTFDRLRETGGGSGGGGGATRSSNGGGNSTSGNTSRETEKKNVNADEGNQNNNNSSNRSSGGDKKNLRNDDGNRTTPKRR
ncbi:MAG: hypothetical protein HRU80_07040 [Ignavibacteriales bacterium]|nr:hypothetical protein [Ignavibacteriaceae bacterium]MCK6613502.1 hypothetical protein [Ignavibacteriaceae bacterium]QOJ28644.1 MAG: hypothetical protein HRU80_07040 [Ignavibacteriales bacterium]